jgi:para-aminobenzoate synthetase component 1
VHLWAGGGITVDSDPRAEVDEAAAKAAPMRAALAGP